MPRMWSVMRDVWRESNLVQDDFRKEVIKYTETLKVLDLCATRGLVSKTDGGKFEANVMESVSKDENMPFIVIEGLDGSGKTFLTNELKTRYKMELMQTPPTQFKEFRSFFDTQPEFIRRAFYSLGNYWAGEDVLHCLQPVVMDRFWHSTASYGVAGELKSATDGAMVLPEIIEWPKDLVRPNVVIFLEVSEQERVRRHSSRKEFTNTVEEQRLAQDVQFRQNTIQFYKSIVGPKFVQVNADGTRNQVLSAVTATLEQLLPVLRTRASETSSSNVKQSFQ